MAGNSTPTPTGQSNSDHEMESDLDDTKDEMETVLEDTIIDNSKKKDPNEELLREVMGMLKNMSASQAELAGKVNNMEKRLTNTCRLELQSAREALEDYTRNALSGSAGQHVDVNEHVNKPPKSTTGTIPKWSGIAHGSGAIGGAHGTGATGGALGLGATGGALGLGAIGGAHVSGAIGGAHGSGATGGALGLGAIGGALVSGANEGTLGLGANGGALDLGAIAATHGSGAIGGAHGFGATGGALGPGAIGGAHVSGPIGGTLGSGAIGGAHGTGATGGALGLGAIGCAHGTGATGGALGLGAIGGTHGFGAVGGAHGTGAIGSAQHSGPIGGAKRSGATGGAHGFVATGSSDEGVLNGIGMYGLDGGSGSVGMVNVNGNRFESQLSPYINPRKLIDLPEFNGNPEAWPVFSTMFWESSNAYRYTSLENLLRLQKSLKGTAKDEVKGLLISPLNVSHIMSRLEFTYGRPELLIKSQMDMVNQILPFTENNMEKMVPFAAKVENLVIFLQSANATQYLQNPSLIEQLVGKMPMSKRIQWIEYTSTLQSFPNLKDLSIWLSYFSRSIARAAVVCSTGTQLAKNEYKGQQKSVMQTTKKAEETEKQYKIECFQCQGDHYFNKCEVFSKAGIKDKWAMVKRFRLCFGCLRRGHTVQTCKNKRECQKNGCKKNHHPSLHEEEKTKEENATTKEVTVNTIQPGMSKLLFKVVPVEISGPNNTVIETYAFLDEGSSASLMNEKLAHMLGVKEPKTKLTLNWIESRATDVMSMECNVRIRASGGGKKWLQFNGNTVPNLQLPLQSVNVDELKGKYGKLRNLPIKGYIDADPMLLIGINNCHLISAIKSVYLDRNLFATKTPLGWCIYGSTGIQKESSPILSVVFHACIQKEDIESEMHQIVADYFTTENFGVKAAKEPLESASVVRARNILKSTTKQLEGSYETGLLWKEDEIHFPDSFEMALKRLHGVENKMHSLGKMKEYDKAIMDFVEKGYAVKLSQEEAAVVGPRTWYLPHFGVYNINKPKKMRLVFDAAASIDGVSLNSKLLKGPDENPPLTEILFKFRQGKVAVCADIKEMFLQVQVCKADQDSLRFLWRHGNKNKDVDTYQMRVMIFGAACSPCCAQYIKNINAQNATIYRDKVIQAIKSKHYVDDFVASFETEEEASAISSEVKRVHKMGNFELRGFVSNSMQVQQMLNEVNEDDHVKAAVSMDNGSVDKILGMCWDSQRDEFVFDLKLNRVDKDIALGIKCPTKRQLLSLVMSVYDPFGMLSDLMIYGKVLIQDVWRTGIHWNDLLPDKIYACFKQWVLQLERVKDFKLKRCYSPEFLASNDCIELNIFVDASEQAFAAVAYWRISCCGEIKIIFVSGKARCAPLKMLSIPRLELQAAVLGTRLRKTILESHDVKVKSATLWSDSRTVISWIRSDHRQYKQFVAHRVSEILDSTDENDWRWVPTDLNPADKATKTNKRADYITGSVWIKGPEFLLLGNQYWPSMDFAHSPDDLAERRKNVMAVFHESVIELSRFSNYLRLKRTMGWALRFIHKCRGLNHKEDQGELTIRELHKAEVILCKIAQNQAYGQEIEDLKESGIVSKNSCIYSLTPKLNVDEIITVGGRLEYAMAISERSRHPVILPSHHALTELIIKWYHEVYHHQNEELIVNEIRRKFWIINLRKSVKRAKSACQHCKNEMSKPVPPLMGQLPKDRVTPFQRPFSFVGLDYFGPVLVTIGRRHEKRWVALFTCLTVRAVHMELAADLSTDACILCIRNFVNRRGVPVKIRSDMGTNFVGADKEIRNVKDLFDWDYIKSEISKKGIEWQFNCPSNPSSGGCWERMVRTTKRVLDVTLKEKAPQVETLRSLLIEAENIINSRPLTHLPVNMDDPEPLTPNHFLLGSTNSTQTPGDDSKLCLRKQYRIAQQLKNCFWRRWIREYLPTLTRRTKWHARTKPITEGDVVIICEDNQPRGCWKKGIIVRTIPAKDGHVRLAEVQTSTGILKRPVSKLAVLDVLGKT